MKDFPLGKSGLRVRRSSVPDRMAVTTGKMKEAGPFTLVQVEFGPGEKSYIRVDKLELVPDSPEETDELLRSRRWSGPDSLRRALAIEKLKGHLTNVFYSMEASKTDFFPHQFKPVMKFVESPTGRILIADEVGLGKTIEAIYIWKEIEAREHAKRLLIVCPAMLREKWRNDLERLFSIDAEIVDAKVLKGKLGQIASAPATTGFHLIVNFESIRTPRNYLESDSREGWQNTSPRAEIGRLLDSSSKDSDEPLLDLVVIDEAHYMRNPSTQTNLLGRLLGDASKHMVLLTATPVQIGSENLFNLLRLLDPDAFENSYQFDRMLEANAPIVSAQQGIWSVPPDLGASAEAIRIACKSEYFSNDQRLSQLPVELQSGSDLTPARRVELGRMLEARSLVGPYMTRSRKREIGEKRAERTAQVLPVKFTEQESQVYERFTHKLRNNSVGLRGVSIFALIGRQRQMASSLPAAIHGWHEGGILSETTWEDFQRFLNLDGTEIPELDLPEIGPDLAVELESVDSKYSALQDFLERHLNENPQEKAIIFAFYRGTLRYLERRLEADGFKTALIMGGDGMSRPRQEVLEQFADPKGPSILLSSEVGSEGIDLQFCRTVINYDLPWNPMRVEQRIGRVDRLGQKADRISIVNLVVESTIEDRILSRLYDRIEIFRASIGDLEEILGEVSEALLEKLFNPELTDSEREILADQSIMAIESKRQSQEQLESQAVNLIGFSDYLTDSIKEARDLGRWLAPEELMTLVGDFFRRQYPGTVLAPADNLSYALNIQLSQEARHALANFIERRYPTRKTQLAVTSRSILCLFDPRHTEKLPRGSELVDPTHPFLRWIESEISKSDDGLMSTVAIRVSSKHTGLKVGLYAFSSQMWSFQGMRTEKIIAHRAVGVDSAIELDLLDSERLIVSAARDGKRMPRGVLPEGRLINAIRIQQNCMKELSNNFAQHMVEFELENSQRSSQQLISAQRFAERKITNLRERIARMKEKELVRSIPMFEGQIRKQEEFLDIKKRHIENGRKVYEDMQEIANGLILLESE